ncbi:DUF2127 domain-containing protein [Lactococcus cremoris]|uniref:DUF2127 domain-containing protein n=1 Tax=Lactococcus lactis subsp. cremoris TaxID=1359 RepID=UPI0009C0C79E|nr:MULTISPECIES: DUF2127 domain-containing protein [Lactococcus]ARE26115.1 DUF2127 domain-containing protein [Lactococcus cremoris]MCT0459095.1 DUF2127 domain-containing protein [Lactococcus cremoris]MCT4417320.1 DUF2127 domain-containing protein [Lactococcus cremoris]PFH00981.1 hypothetical protein BW156_04920 [Lactococcus cremoris]
MEKVKNKEELLDFSFNAMLLGKSIFAFVEFLFGLLLIFIPLDLIKSTIQHLAASIAFAPLSSMITNAGERVTSDATLFAVIYLLLHGALKLVTLALLWRKILWSYPLSIVLLLGFITYQMFEFFNHGAIPMLALCVVDLVMITLTLLEYRKLKAQLSKGQSYSSLKNIKIN